MGTTRFGGRQLDPSVLDGVRGTGRAVEDERTPAPRYDEGTDGRATEATGDIEDIADVSGPAGAGSLTAMVSRMLCDEWRLRVDGCWATALPVAASAEPDDEAVGETTSEGAAASAELYLSATPASVGAVLQRAVPILAAHRAAFTMAANPATVRRIGAPDCDSSVAGKALTVRPGADTDAEVLTRELHLATAGIAGPRILTAIPYCPRSLVHRPSEAGTPAGEARRTPWQSGPNLLAGRYLVGQTLRRSADGGVALAVDTHRPAADPRVVVRHARRHADVDEFGRDARARLLHEARVLHLLHPAAPAPEPLRVFAMDQDLFLVERYLSGVPFGRWVAAHAGDGPGVPPYAALPMARRLLRLLSAVHSTGIVLRGLDPDKLLVDPDGRPKLVGLESACAIGETARSTARAGCPGYRAPEQAAEGAGPQAGIAEDLYALGGMLFLMATGSDPALPEHDDGRDRQERLSTWLAATAAHSDTAGALAPAACGLLSDDPDRRCDLVTAAARLEPRRPSQGLPAAAPGPGSRRLLDDGLSHLADTMDPDTEQLWPAAAAGDEALAVQRGAAGVLAALLADVSAGNHRHRQTARAAATWLAERCGPAPDRHIHPGLYSGAAGTAWVLADAGRLLDQPHLVEEAAALTRALPTRWADAGVADGLAGALLTQLRLASLTGRSEFLERASGYVRHLRDSAPAPQYGFAHGTAGIGYALLTAGLMLREPDALELAREAGDLLCRTAVRDAAGGASWPVGPDLPRRRSHWCTGAAGIGTFLARLWACDGQQRHAELVSAAASSVFTARWAAPTGASHGLAGDGHFLLDVAELLPDPLRRRWAEDLVPFLSARHARRRGRAVVADDSSTGTLVEFGTGLAGVLAFLLRLHHRVPRPFMLDEMVAPSVSGRVASESDSPAAKHELA